MSYRLNLDTHSSQATIGYLRPESWQEKAACRDAPDPEIFHPSSSSISTLEDPQIQEALAYCAACPVTKECLSFAEAQRDVTMTGIWGGKLLGRKLVPTRPADATNEPTYGELCHKGRHVVTPETVRLRPERNTWVCKLCQNEDAQALQEARKAGTVPVTPFKGEHGTEPARRWHRKNGVALCDRCRKRRIVRTKDPVIRPECGTTAGYAKHGYYRELSCRACTQAASASRRARKRAA